MAKRVCIVGSGNWGSAIATLVGVNAARYADQFHSRVHMWVFEEMVDGKKLTEIINERHENVKYLAGVKLPENIVAVPDVSEAAADADVLIFVIPHQFIVKALSPLARYLETSAAAPIRAGYARAVKKEGGAADGQQREGEETN